MRPLGWLGVLLVALGVYVAARGANVKTPEKVLKVGDIEVTSERDHRVPPWAGAIAVGAGFVLVLSGAKRKTF